MSYDNFRRIWDLRTRRGEDLLGFFPEVASLTQQIRLHQVASGSATIAGGPRPASTATADAIRELRKQRRSELKARLLDLSVKVSAQIDDGSFEYRLRTGALVRGRQTYQIDLSDPAIYFTSRQVEWNIRRAFNVRPANRNLIVEQIVRTLQDGTPKLIGRTDLRQFYESIQHQALIQFLTNSGRLSATTRRLVRQLLDEYSAATGKTAGLPRGLALSATLAEAFLTPLDRDLAKMGGVLLYARYVDDILLIFVNDSFNPSLESRKKGVRDAVKRAGLVMNAGKTNYLSTSGPPGASQRLTFLGYQIEFEPGCTTVDISKKRAKRYREKIDASLATFESNAKDPRALPALHERLKFLTGNTRLVNNKRQALIGSHFSNPLITAATPAFVRLDKHLRKGVNNLTLDQTAKAALGTFTFADGIENRRYHNFSPRQLQGIVTVWRNA
ncbi:antiviral reverse transcriptase Drt3a [Aeromicrobium endophyticum]|uniref:antiviral reverse transcriptase Drt3a n=1 Tax=Aeromicrobium endophyticum TaxID=2292704 RepID=UPI0018F51E7E|nr:antiviral reverse transcriptase Drt3a [Aeromicrobium endophyticum]